MLVLGLKEALLFNKFDLKARLRKLAAHSTKFSFLFVPPGVEKVNICLVAHIDISGDDVKKKKKVCYDPVKQIYFSTSGQLGGDDRAGVYSCLKLYNTLKIKPYLLLTDLEEEGGIGAKEAVADSSIKNILKGMDYFIELDRQGNNDCVFYAEEEEKFKTIFTSRGWEEKTGTFSDVKTISGELLISSVNLSVGYYRQHTGGEYLKALETEGSVQRVSNILQSHKGEKYICKKKEFVVKYYTSKTAVYLLGEDNLYRKKYTTWEPPGSFKEEDTKDQGFKNKDGKDYEKCILWFICGGYSVTGGPTTTCQHCMEFKESSIIKQAEESPAKKCKTCGWMSHYVDKDGLCLVCGKNLKCIGEGG